MALEWCAECTRHSVDPQPQSTCPTAPAARLELPPGAPAAGIVPRSWQVLAVGNYPPASDVWRSRVAALPPPASASIRYCRLLVARIAIAPASTTLVLFASQKRTAHVCGPS